MSYDFGLVRSGETKKYRDNAGFPVLTKYLSKASYSGMKMKE